MRKILTISMLMIVLPMAAQDMNIENFNRQKHSLLKDVKVEKDRKNAILLLSTDESGFQFKADAKTDIQAEEGDGLLTLKVPHKTRWLTITHPDYGQLSWRAPDKGFRKKKKYHAYLQTYHPEKEYKLQKQWVVFRISPQNAIVHVDSGMTIVRDGKAQYHLPIGKHPYMVEAPFFETVEDTLELTDEEKLVLPVRLQPTYSYLKVKTPLKNSRIYVNNEYIGHHEAVSNHLAAGHHRLTVFVDSICYYDAPVTIGASQKTVVELTEADLRQKRWREKNSLMTLSDEREKSLDSVCLAKDQVPVTLIAPVKIKAPDNDTEIWIDRELVGTSTWEGTLDEGFHIISSQKDGRQSAARNLWIEDEFPKEVSLGGPQADLGFLNIHSNVMEAAVYINDSLMGMTPCIVGDLAAGKTYTVRLEHQFYKPVEQQVLVLGNDMVNVEMMMKKARKGKRKE